jgi:hypothetical protein
LRLAVARLPPATPRNRVHHHIDITGTARAALDA